MYKYLGMLLDSSLTYAEHVKKLTSKINYSLYLFGRMRRRINYKTAKCIYKGMILTIFNYGDVVYEGCMQVQLKKLQRLQNRGLKQSTIGIHRTMIWMRCIGI